MKYTYIIPEDFLYKKVSVDKLEYQIRNSNIKIALDSIKISNVLCEIFFKDILDDIDLNILNNLVNKHDGITLPENVLTKVKIFEENSTGVYYTQGHYQASSFKMDIIESEESFSFSFPYYISINSSQWYVNENMLEDEFNVEISPDTIIGYIIENTIENDNKIKVSDSVMNNISKGYYIKLNNIYYKVVNKDEENFIYLDKNLDKTYNNGELIRMTIRLIDYCYFNSIGKMDVGLSKIGSEIIPPNTEIKINYFNNSSINKVFSIFVDYLY